MTALLTYHALLLCCKNFLWYLQLPSLTSSQTSFYTVTSRERRQISSFQGKVSVTRQCFLYIFSAFHLFKGLEKIIFHPLLLLFFVDAGGLLVDPKMTSFVSWSHLGYLNFLVPKAGLFKKCNIKRKIFPHGSWWNQSAGWHLCIWKLSFIKWFIKGKKDWLCSYFPMLSIENITFFFFIPERVSQKQSVEAYKTVFLPKTFSVLAKSQNYH